jgi:hypothetical protein
MRLSVLFAWSFTALAASGCADNVLDVDDYDRSCALAADCIIVTVGDMCEISPSCMCGGSAINVSSRDEWRADVDAVSCFDRDTAICRCGGQEVACEDGVCVAVPLEL